MTLLRRILFYSFLAVFGVTGAVLLFSAQGYRYASKKGAIELTGEIGLDSRPHGVAVLLDGAAPLGFFDRLVGKKSVTTPARIQWLLSGEYRVSLDKDGYYPWSAAVTVLPGKAVVLSDIELLPRGDLHFEPLTGTVTHAAAASEKVLYSTSDARLVVYDRKTREATVLRHFEHPIDILSVSRNEKQMAIASGPHLWILPVSSRDFSKPFQRAGITQVAWSKNDFFFGLSPKGIWTPSKQPHQFILQASGSFVDFSADELVAALDARRVLHVYDPNTQPFPEVAKRETDGERIANHANGIIAVSSIRRSDMVLFSESRPRAEPWRLSHAHSLAWRTRTDAIVWDDFEIAAVSTVESASKPTLITRQSEPITAVFAPAGSSAVFVLTHSGTLRASDLRTLDPRNRYSIFSPNNFGIVTLFESGAELVGIAKKDGVSGIISIPAR